MFQKQYKCTGFSTDKHCDDNPASFTAHFTTLQDASRSPPAISGLTPLFRDNAHSLALIKHGMDVIAKATEHLNHGKVPVLNVD